MRRQERRGIAYIATTRPNQRHLWSKKKNFASITVKDNGIGIPEDMDIESAKTLGMTIVKLLSKQLNGVITINRELGTEIVLRFPL
ncbi:hypothetical protein JXA84_02840 [candidate division WOR-3 bacterium]|nr:hypothetical protein [candidate division WOR-3 bacterium]